MCNASLDTSWLPVAVAYLEYWLAMIVRSLIQVSVRLASQEHILIIALSNVMPVLTTASPVLHPIHAVNAWTTTN